jgi:hypothetical protein
MNERHRHPDDEERPLVAFATVNVRKDAEGLVFSGVCHDWVSTLANDDVAECLHDAGDALHLLAETFERNAGDGNKGLHLVPDDGGDDGEG